MRHPLQRCTKRAVRIEGTRKVPRITNPVPAMPTYFMQRRAFVPRRNRLHHPGGFGTASSRRADISLSGDHVPAQRSLYRPDHTRADPPKGTVGATR
jgi:hypothetical protein